ncbi:ribonuclease R [bacterium]|nr:ribonuclease R [bacterium]
MNEEKLREIILETIKSYNKKKIRRRELYGKIGVKGLGYDEFKRVLTDIEKTGDLVRNKGRRFSLPEDSGIYTGIFSASKNGGGFVHTDSGEVLYVRDINTGSALSGDRVRAKIIKKRHPGLTRTGEVVDIIERRKKPVVGVFRKRKKTAYVIPSEDGFPEPMIVQEGGESEAAEGDVVVVRLLSESTGFSRPLCVVEEVLGQPDSPGVDVLALARRYELPVKFSDEVVAESKQVREDLGPAMFERRRDLRGLVTFTIDPVDAKDFDDALSISRTGDGGYELGVHIADVSHYVPDGSAMDREALSRGMSCYLVDRVIPMLPERLSNDLCSLKPDIDRLTKSVIAMLDREGNVLSHEIADTVIHSRRRLTYEEVQDFLDGRPVSGDGIPAEVGEALAMLSELTDALALRRAERGALDLELPEAYVVLDDNGKPVDIVKRRRLKSHRVVEEAMILANILTAERLGGMDALFLYRVHDEPDEMKLAAFGEVADMLGYEFHLSRIRDDRYIEDFLESLRGKKHERLLNMLLLRSMKKAVYSPRNIGHYGLRLPVYTHFTSPIRRYPDLIVHRQLEAFVIGGGSPVRHDKASFEDMGAMITEREITTDAAERESIKMKTAEFMRNHLGEEFEGTVSGMMPFGFFVELDRYFVEGLVHVSTLDDDYYMLDKTGIALAGRNTGRRFVLGDRLRVAVARADKERGEVDFVIVGSLDNGPRKKRKKTLNGRSHSRPGRT